MSKVMLSALCLGIQFTSVSATESIELCQTNSKDCTFVLLSDKGRVEVSSVMTEIAASKESEKITQASTYTQTNEISFLVNPERAKIRLSPFSTFKIPNTLIALDTKAITDIKKPLSYDKKKYPKAAWWPSSWTKSEHNIASAFKVSMVPIYRQLAVEIGEETMQSYINKFSYGNQDISSGLDDFWLDGSIKISAIEQVRFLQKMHKAQLAVSKQSVEQLKEIMLVEKTDNYSFYAKTGTGTIADDINLSVNLSVNLNVDIDVKAESKDKSSKLGWYVGFVENAQGVHYFALNISRASYKEINAERKKMVRNHLKKAGVI